MSVSPSSDEESVVRRRPRRGGGGINNNRGIYIRIDGNNHGNINIYQPPLNGSGGNPAASIGYPVQHDMSQEHVVTETPTPDVQESWWWKWLKNIGCVAIVVAAGGVFAWFELPLVGAVAMASLVSYFTGFDERIARIAAELGHTSFGPAIAGVVRYFRF